MKRQTIALSAISLTLLAAACSDLKDPVPVSTAMQTIPAASPEENAYAALAQNDEASIAKALAQVATQAATQSSKQPSLDGLKVPKLIWGSCGSVFQDRECAKASVPLDYEMPNGESIELALVRYPAKNVAERIGTLFVNPGGPGGSATDLIGSSFGQDLHDLLDGRFDIVGTDPRGISRSEPLSCFTSTSEQAEVISAIKNGLPGSAATELAFFEKARELTKLCYSKPQKIIQSMSTADVARDMEMLRRAVGDEKLTYFGFSYGTYLGNTYANLFPNKIRAMVFDGVLDPVLYSAGLQVVSDRTGRLKVIREFMRLCDEAGANCALSGPEGAQARYDRVVSALQAAPINLPNGETLTYADFVLRVSGSLSDPETWGGEFGTAAYIAALLNKVNKAAGADDKLASFSVAGNVPALVAMTNADAGNLPKFTSISGEAESSLGSACSDIAYPKDFPTWQGVSRYADSGSIYGRFTWWGFAACSNWPVSKQRYTGPWSATTSAPVLIVGNFFDPATDYSGALANNKLLSNSRLLSYAGWGHTAFGRNECVTTSILNYLVNGALPEKNKVCEANSNPFEKASKPTSANEKRSTGSSGREFNNN